MLTSCNKVDTSKNEIMKEVIKESKEDIKINDNKTLKIESVKVEKDKTQLDTKEEVTKNINDKNNSNIDEKVAPQKNIQAKEQEILISFGGDVMMDSYIGDYIKDYGVDYPWTDVKSVLSEDDLSVVNLETSVSNRGNTKKPKGYGFRSAPYTLKGLVNAGIETVSLANNHVLDFGLEAFDDTLQSLKQYNIDYVGAGKNIEDAEQLLVKNINGINIGFISYSSILPWDSWTAYDDRSGVAGFNSSNYDRLLNNVKANEDKCDLLVVLLHWGTEYHKKPKQWQIELAHKLIDEGADAIVGHHPHVMQGVEIYNNKPILYSIGNFVFLKNDEECGKTGIFQLKYSELELSTIQYHPVYIKYCKANLLDIASEKALEYIENVNNASSIFGQRFSNKGYLIMP